MRSRAIGMRFHPTRGAMSVGVSKGGLPPDSCCEDEEYALQQMEEAIKTYHDPSKWDLLSISVAQACSTAKLRPHDRLLLSVVVCDMFHILPSIAGLPDGGNECKADYVNAAVFSV